MATCDLTTLMADARCFDCLDNRQLQLIIAQLLCEISEAGGGGGGCSGCIKYGNGDPNGVVDGNRDNIYVQQDAPGRIWVKLTDGANTGWT